MRRSFILLSTALLLSACANKPEPASVCSGNTLRACEPVVYFDLGSSKIKKSQNETLQWAYDKMVRFPREHILVTGYADAAGNATKNFQLSKQRAKAIKQYFVKKGIDPNRIAISFRGEFEPVCTTSDCQNLNRRVELKMFKPNGGFDPNTLDKVSAKVDGLKCVLCEEE